MADSAIEWTGKTWNPTTGCDRISPGCDHCYALTLAKRLKAMGQAKYQTDGDPRTSGPGFGVAVHPSALTDPLFWRKPTKVFVNSMSDLFHARVPVDLVASVWATMAMTPQHTYQILTKRPERMPRIVCRDRMLATLEASVEASTLAAAPWPVPNVWLGTSIELDEYARRTDALRQTSAAVRFLSLEPLLGPLPSLDFTGIDWTIVGGESGPGARPMELEWVRDLIDRARDAGSAVFVKQLGSVLGKDFAAGGHGADWTRWPADLRIREYPEAANA